MTDKRSAVRKPALFEKIILPLLLPFVLLHELLYGIVVNAWQLTCRIIISPFSLCGYHKAISPLIHVLGLNFVWMLTGMGGCRFRVFSNSSTKELQKQTTAIMISNHCGSLDWLVIAWMMIRLKKVHCLRSIAKASLAVIPVMGWTWYFSDFIFLKRRMADDKRSLERGADRLRSASKPGFFGRLPYWLCLFPEGTRSTPAKLAESHKYQKDNGIVPMKNLLYPRTKGFVELWKLLGDDSDNLIDLTLGYPEDIPSSNKVLAGRGAEICILINVHKPDEVGKGEDAHKQFLIDAFRKKDADLDYYKQNGKFDYPEIFSHTTRFADVFTVGVVFVSCFTISAIAYFLLSASTLTLQICGALYAIAVLLFAM